MSDKENGNSAFDELQLRDYMGGCGVTDDDLIAFCWKHCQRTKDLISAPTENSEKSQPMNIQSSSLPGPTDIKPTLSALDTQRRRSIPQGIFLAGLSFVFVTLIVLVVTSIGSNIPAAINSVTNSLIARPYMGGMITIVQDYEHLGCMTAENIDKVASNELAEPDEPTQRVIIKNCGRTSTSEQVTGGWHTNWVAKSDEYIFVNTNSGKCLDRTDSDLAVQQTCSPGDPAQLWKITLLGAPDKGTRTVTLLNSKDGNQACLTASYPYIFPTFKSPLMELKVAPCANTDLQKFLIITNPER